MILRGLRQIQQEAKTSKPQIGIVKEVTESTVRIDVNGDEYILPKTQPARVGQFVLLVGENFFRVTR